jgi:stress response protein YsnF
MRELMMIEGMAPEKIAVVEETAVVDKVRRVTGVVRAKTETREESVIVDESVLTEQVIIERVPMDRWIDHPLAVRQEGDTTIIPVVKEVVVVEKRLKLVEEVHVTKQQITKHEPQNVTLRRQHVVVERLAGPDGDGPD